MAESTPSDDVFAGRMGPRRAPRFGGLKPDWPERRVMERVTIIGERPV